MLSSGRRLLPSPTARGASSAAPPGCPKGSARLWAALLQPPSLRLLLLLNCFGKPRICRSEPRSGRGWGPAGGGAWSEGRPQRLRRGPDAAAARPPPGSRRDRYPACQGWRSGSLSAGEGGVCIKSRCGAVAARALGGSRAPPCDRRLSIPCHAGVGLSPGWCHQVGEVAAYQNERCFLIAGTEEKR